MSKILKWRDTNMLVKYTLTVVLLLASMCLFSCRSQIPLATDYPYTEQQRMQAASHWNVLAADVVNQLGQSQRVSKETPLAVYPKFYFRDREDPVIWTTKEPLTAADESDRLATIPFKRAYQNYLIAQLVDSGYNVIDEPTGAGLIMTFDIQLIKHGERRVRSPHLISRLRRIFAGSDVKPGKYELVITTSVKSGKRYIMCHTGTYYVNNPPWDSSYEVQGKVMEVVDK